MLTLTCCQDNILTENIWFVLLGLKHHIVEMRGDVTDARRQTNNEQLKIELLSQWKLEAESRNKMAFEEGRKRVHSEQQQFSCRGSAGWPTPQLRLQTFGKKSVSRSHSWWLVIGWWRVNSGWGCQLFVCFNAGCSYLQLQGIKEKFWQWTMGGGCRSTNFLQDFDQNLKSS